MQWEEIWKEDEILIESDLIHNLKVWRKLEYYIDSNSAKILELGTREYPYKNFNLAIFEINNFVSSTDKEVTIKLSHSWDHEILHGETFIYNITNLKLEPYDTRTRIISDEIVEYGKDLEQILKISSV